MNYLLGFPTPVIEIILGLFVLFVALSVYFAINFEGTTIREQQSREKPPEEVSNR